MAERSAAQKRATARLVAMNKRMRGGSARPRSTGGARGFGLRAARKVSRHTYGAVETVGAATTAYGLLGNGNQSFKGGNSVIGQLRAGSVTGAVGAIGPTLQMVRQSGTMTQKQVVGGAVTWALGRLARRVAPFTHRIKVNLDKKTAISFT